MRNVLIMVMIVVMIMSFTACYRREPTYLEGKSHA
jgi:predicted small lipoprotein YifL